MNAHWVVGVDLGTAETRCVAAAQEPGGALSGSRVEVRAAGVADSEREIQWERAAQVIRLVKEQISGPISAVGVGLAGAPVLHPDRNAEVSKLAREARTAVVAAPRVITAHLGALGGRAGAIIALGTGSAAFATDWVSYARTVDGLGPVVGDRSSGTQIGFGAVRAAARAYDGVEPAGARLLDVLRAALGEPETWHVALTQLHSIPTTLSSIVPAVARLATAGDAVAQSLIDAAVQEAAATLCAALEAPTAPLAAVTGGLRSLGPQFERDIAAAVRARHGDVIVSAAGDALDGAVALARSVLDQRMPTIDHIWHARAGRGA